MYSHVLNDKTYFESERLDFRPNNYHKDPLFYPFNHREFEKRTTPIHLKRFDTKESFVHESFIATSLTKEEI